MSDEAKNNKLISLIESKERERIGKHKFMGSEIEKSLATHTKKEYNLLKKCMPHKLYKGKEFFNQKYEAMKQNMVELDEAAGKDKFGQANSKLNKQSKWRVCKLIEL